MPVEIKLGVAKLAKITLHTRGNVVDLDLSFCDDYLGGVCLTKEAIDELVYQLLKRRRKLG